MGKNQKEEEKKKGRNGLSAMLVSLRSEPIPALLYTMAQQHATMVAC